MAGLGSDCPVNELFSLKHHTKNQRKLQKFHHHNTRHHLSPHNHHLHQSCFENRVIQVYTEKFLKLTGALGCVFNRQRHPKISGVLCCRKSPQNDESSAGKFGAEGFGDKTGQLSVN